MTDPLPPWRPQDIADIIKGEGTRLDPPSELAEVMHPFVTGEMDAAYLTRQTQGGQWVMFPIRLRHDQEGEA